MSIQYDFVSPHCLFLFFFIWQYSGVLIYPTIIFIIRCFPQFCVKFYHQFLSETSDIEIDDIIPNTHTHTHKHTQTHQNRCILLTLSNVWWKVEVAQEATRSCSVETRIYLKRTNDEKKMQCEWNQHTLTARAKKFLFLNIEMHFECNAKMRFGGITHTHTHTHKKLEEN